MALTRLFKDFFHSEKASGILLILVTGVSIFFANSTLSDAYTHFWHQTLAGKPLEFWINDGLMTVFFFLIGLEIEREIYVGELSNIRNAMLPIFAAIGGMILPAIIHFSFNHGTEFQHGFGIPMATDIAFSLGVLSLLGKRVPGSLKIFLTALAIIDDLGAIIIIAIFYSSGIAWLYLGGAALIFGLLLLLNRLKVRQIWLYLLLGVVMWYFMHHSGVHATITGVLVAFTIPFYKGDESSPSNRLQAALHLPVAFFIVPIFALANTAIHLPNNFMEHLSSSNSLGIILGLFIGKPIGVFLFSMLAVLLGVASLPKALGKIEIVGAGMLAGIGFTMSIFVTLLAFDNTENVVDSKIAILVASILSGVVGFIFLLIFMKKKNKKLNANKAIK